ncbi:MAG: circularly permuted type 2 ATP-grasp protein [Parachlamydiaceae bacterium]
MKTGQASSELSRCVGLFENYQLLRSSYDEYFSFERREHPILNTITRFFDQISHEHFSQYHTRAHELFKQRGVTFNVYSDQHGQEKIFPFDLIPRVIHHEEWKITQQGLTQRIQALNAFLNDIYGKQHILKEKVLPKEIVLSSKGYLKELQGLTPPKGTYIHIAGIDLIRENHTFYVLEDNLKVPSGISYVLENRRMSKQFFPNIFNQIPILGVDEYPLRLRESLLSLVPETRENPVLVLLTPGPYNSAYFEHVFLSQRMGCPLVQNTDLIIENDYVYLKTLKGLLRVDVIYRRIDDEYLDPTVFNPSSLLGVPGLIHAYAKGNVILANAPGNGVADDKAIYPYVPEMIRYYLKEEPILAQVETYSCTDDKSREHVLNNLASCVIKVVNQSGGYGIIIGEQASKDALDNARDQILKNPRDYIAQPLKQLSSCPTLHNGQICPRRIDLRPFILSGKSTWVLPGGLTRVALNADSYIVNSSQGGGSKDTWILGAL